MVINYTLNIIFIVHKLIFIVNLYIVEQINVNMWSHKSELQYIKNYLHYNKLKVENTAGFILLFLINLYS